MSAFMAPPPSPVTGGAYVWGPDVCKDRAAR